jgi:hypothetical protein
MLIPLEDVLLASLFNFFEKNFVRNSNFAVRTAAELIIGQLKFTS